jgi:hypothetical protein
VTATNSELPGQTVPRPLTALERDVLEYVLSTSGTRFAELREQVPKATVVGLWRGSPSIDLSVDEAARSSELPDGVVPVDAHVVDNSGQYVGELIVWIADGRLTGLEYAWITDTPPEVLPDIATIRLAPR